ncbi:Retrovirus-related Pol polyprotein from transposon 412 [Merluccius polli]|uniref:Gypsy retrotransposon integrase-like protein 1 n=1 Tax=Merluccius polli TaxID=89951 RepID=A0AA47MDJ5_MERPO|nr:Retrovirus-related Pol polyprotein from transposon 412 [Merluccius polli]
MHGVGKIKAYKKLNSKAEYINLFRQLGENFTPSTDLSQALETFTCDLYGLDCQDVNKARAKLFKSGRCSERDLPPNQDSLYKHIQRASYQTAVHRRSLESYPDIPPPVHHGWKMAGEFYEIRGFGPPPIISVADGQSAPVRILRDTGAAQSFMLRDLLPLSEKTATGSSVLVQGIEMGFIRVPLHRVCLKSDLVCGDVVVGVRSSFPIPSVNFILGNDIAGPKVWSRVWSHASKTLQSVSPVDIDLSDSFVAQPKKRERLFEKLEQSVPKVKIIQNNTANISLSRDKLILLQKSDATLVYCFQAALSDPNGASEPCAFFIKDGVLMRMWRPRLNEEWGTVYQIVVPTEYRTEILAFSAHDGLAGHMGMTKTYNRILQHFFWPGLKRDVARYCKSCHVCQVSGKPNQAITSAPLQPIPAIEHEIIDCVVPLPRSRSGYQYLLTVMCTATRFPEAIPLRKITTRSVTRALLKFFAFVGLPRIIQSDRGTNFTAKMFSRVIKSLHIKHRTSSAFHPESQGALERYHQSFKSMLRAYCLEVGGDWEEPVPWLLFASREVVQESLGFSPTELLFSPTRSHQSAYE